MAENYELCYRPKYQDEKGEWQPNELRAPQPESIRQVIKILMDGALDGTGTARGSLLGDEQGLGKTATAIIAVYALRNLVGGNRRILVVASKNLLPVWKAEIERWQASPDLVITLKDGHSINPDTVMCGWLLVSYDTVGRYFPPARRSQMPPFDLLIADEIQHFKEPSIKRTRMVYGGSDPKRKQRIPPIPAKKAICLSGTPVKNRVEEIYTALHYLDPTRWPDRKPFVDQHYEKGYLVDNKGRVTGATRNLDPLRNTLRSTILVRHRKDGILLPKRYERIYLGLNDLGERSLFEDFANGRLGIRIVNGKLRVALRERDWKAYRRFKDELNRKQAKMREMTGHAKYAPLLKYLRNKARTTQDKFVVFLHHDEIIQDLAENLRGEGYGCVTLTGDTKDSRVPRQIFKQAGCRFFIGNLQAAGVGITLIESSHCIFGEIPWTPAEWMQAQDRLHRFGQDREVNITTFLLWEGYDAEMFDAVESKTRTLRHTLDHDWNTQLQFADLTWRSTDDDDGFELVRGFVAPKPDDEDQAEIEEVD